MLDNKFIKNNVVYMTSMALGGLLGYLFHFMVSRQLSVAQYGELQALVSVMMISSVFFSAVTYFLIKKSAVFALHNDVSGQVYFVDFARRKLQPLMLWFGVAFLLLMPVVKNFLHLSDYIGLLVVGVSMLVFFYASFFSNSLQGWKDFLALSVIGVTAAIFKVVSGYGLTFFSSTASTVIFSFFISAVIGWLMAKMYFQKKWSATDSLKKSGEWRKKYFSGISFKKSFAQIMFFSLGLAVVGNLDMLLIKNVAPAELAGFYGALSVLGKVLLWLNFSVVSVLFPEACSVAYAGKPVSAKIIGGSYAFIFLISIPIIILYYFFAQFFIGVMFGQNYLKVASDLWLFGMMAFFSSLMLLESKLALARYAFKASLVLFLTAVILAGLIVLRHNDIRTIVIAVSTAYLCGWLAMLALNSFYRFRRVSE